MFAVVESGKITSMPRGNKGITIGDNQYPASIFTFQIDLSKNNPLLKNNDCELLEEWFL